MLRDIQMLLENSVALTAVRAKQIHAMLIGIIIASLATIIIMWGINIAGGKQVNIFFFLLGGLYIIIKVTKPFTVAVAAGAGAVVAGLADKDKSQGALTGLYALYKVTVGALFGFWVLAGLLSTWSFEEKPVSFFYIMAMVLTIAVTVEFYGLKGGKMPAKVILTYAVAVILVAFWQSMTEEQKDMVPTIPFTSAANKKEVKENAETAKAQAAADAAAQEAARIARAKVAEESLTPAKVGPCVVRYTNQANCVEVVFAEHTYYDREAIVGHCPIFDPADAIKSTHLGGDQYRYTGPPGLKAMFFDLPIGQKIGTIKCGS